MKKYLVTGFSGFVGRHFLDFLEKAGEAAYVRGIDLHRPTFDTYGRRSVKCDFQAIDLRSRRDLSRVIKEFRPDFVLHLASYSSVAFSWQKPILAFVNNTNIFLNLVDAVRDSDVRPRILSVGSSEEYGEVSKEDLPLEEDHYLRPVSPYAAARASQEILSNVYVEGYDLDIVLTRSFNHVGPFQMRKFAVPSFASRLVDAAVRGKSETVLNTGDASIVRDFTDVRDVVAAYHLLLTRGRTGQVYNVCSGRGITILEIIHMMAEILSLRVEIIVDPRLVRPADSRWIIGSNRKIKDELGWDLKYSLDRSLSDIIDYWRTIADARS
jgi:GDP-4-dehydro-6-deoxy-D-mannose reductase